MTPGSTPERTPHQRARIAHETSTTSGLVYLLGIGETVSLVIVSPDEISKTMILADGSVAARYLFLPDVDQLGVPWMIQKPRTGDDSSVGVRDDDGHARVASPAQEAVLSRLMRSARRVGGAMPHGVAFDDDGFMHILFDTDGGLTDRTVSVHGRVDDRVLWRLPQTMEA